MTPTQRTLALLRKRGYTAAVVERWNAYAKVRQDLFGCIDVLAIKAGEAVLAVQATTASNVSARVRKAVLIPAVRTWLATGSRFEVWGWAKRGKRCEKKRWACVTVPLSVGDITEDSHGRGHEEGGGLSRLLPRQPGGLGQ